MRNLDNILKNNKGETLDEFLKNYDANKYEKPAVTVDTLLFTVMDEVDTNVSGKNSRLKILLVKRKDHPCIGQWAIPGGFVNMDENIDEAAKRELKEETNVENIYVEQLYTFGDVGRDPRTRIISVAYMGLVNYLKLNIIAGDDAEEAQWFTVEKKKISSIGEESVYEFKILNENRGINIEYSVRAGYEVKEGTKPLDVSIVLKEESSDSIAFDHEKMINLAIDRLREKLYHTPIAYNLLSEAFTIGEVQKIYETILGEELVTSTFSNKISSSLEEIGVRKENSKDKEEKLYRYSHGRF